MLDKEQSELIKHKLSMIQSDMKNSNYQENLYKIYKEEFEEKISSILNQSESEFMNNYIMRMNLILEDLYSSEVFDIKEFILIQKEIERKVYDTLYKKSIKYLTKAWDDLQTTIQQQLKQNQKRAQKIEAKSSIDGISLPIIYLKNFNKHCVNTESPIHTCKGKFIPVFDDNKNITHVICVKCKCSYFSNCILMYCNDCNVEYYSCHMTLEKDYQPATWDKYHCGAIMNDYMRCLDCRDMLYLKTTTGYLTCLNKSCKFEADPNSIFWVCMLCGKEFSSAAKIFNPMEHRTLKIAIKNTLLNKVFARPDSVPCCSINPDSYKFFHKNECKGVLYMGVMRDTNITVCSKCKVMAHNEKFLWTCPICLKRFKSKNRIADNGCIPDEDKNYYLSTENFVSKDETKNKKNISNNKNIPVVAGTDTSYNKQMTDADIIDNSKIKFIKNTKKESLKTSIINEKSNQNKFSILNPSKKVEGKLEEEATKLIENLRGITRNKTMCIPEEHQPRLRTNSKQPFNVVRNRVSSIDGEKGMQTPMRNSRIVLKEVEQCKGENNNVRNNLKKVSISLGTNASKNIDNSPFDTDDKNQKKEKESDKEITKSYPNNINAVNSKPNEKYIQSKLTTFNLKDFTIITQIGEGTFGKIYLVEDKSKNYFSLKKIIANDEFELENFEQEYELINQVKHNNILNILATTKQKLDKMTYGLYILMETGLSDWEKEIKSRLALKKYYTEIELIDILKQIVSALVFMQRKNISHRDIKPQNILIFKDNVYKLADFGEAKKLSMMETNKQLNTLRGTELYMSPLLFNAMRTNQSDIKHNSYKSDVYSVAYCIINAATLNFQSLFEFRRVYEMKTTKVLLDKYLKGKFSQNLIDTLYKMLEINEANRLDFIELEAVINKYF